MVTQRALDPLVNLLNKPKINKEVIWIIKGIERKYRVIADFRKLNLDPLKNFFESYVDFGIQLGLYGQDLIAVDGTKFEADASKRKHYSKNKLKKMKSMAQEKIEVYLHEIETNDKLEECEETRLKKKNLKRAIKTVEEKIKEYVALEKNLRKWELMKLTLPILMLRL